MNRSAEKGTAKEPVDSIVVDELGVVDDAHRGPWHRQVSLLDQESIDAFRDETGCEVEPGAFGENITYRRVSLPELCILDRLRTGDAELEITQIGKVCHGDDCAIFRRVGRCIMPDKGLFARVIKGGAIAAGAPLEHVPGFLRARVITLSERAAAGVYEDRSGQRIADMLEAHFSERPWRLKIERSVIGDHAAELEALIVEARDDGVDLLFTTGSTGVGPTDIAPETAAKLIERSLPGIMEVIRAKFGLENPKARLSRSVAGVAGSMQLYCLPGSPRAVEEYMPEILSTVEHVFYMLRGWDVH